MINHGMAARFTRRGDTVYAYDSQGQEVGRWPVARRTDLLPEAARLLLTTPHVPGLADMLASTPDPIRATLAARHARHIAAVFTPPTPPTWPTDADPLVADIIALADRVDPPTYASKERLYRDIAEADARDEAAADGRTYMGFPIHTSPHVARGGLVLTDTCAIVHDRADLHRLIRREAARKAERALASGFWAAMIPALHRLGTAAAFDWAQV